MEKITEGNVDPWEVLEALGCDNDNPTQCLKTLESREEEDVNNIALPLELVKKVRQKEMSYVTVKISRSLRSQKLGGLRDKHQSVPSSWTLIKPTGLESRWFDPDGWPGTSRTLRRRTEKTC